MQSKKHAHLETLTQNVLGLLIAFIILKLYGLSTSQSIQLQIIFFFASYIRSYMVHRFFNYLGAKHETKI